MESSEQQQEKWATSAEVPAQEEAAAAAAPAAAAQQGAASTARPSVASAAPTHAAIAGLPSHAHCGLCGAKKLALSARGWGNLVDMTQLERRECVLICMLYRIARHSENVGSVIGATCKTNEIPVCISCKEAWSRGVIIHAIEQLQTQMPNFNAVVNATQAFRWLLDHWFDQTEREQLLQQVEIGWLAASRRRAVNASTRVRHHHSRRRGSQPQRGWR